MSSDEEMNLEPGPIPKDAGISKAVFSRGLMVEHELRTWLKAHRRVWRIENKMGGDFGFPDCLLSLNGSPAFVELKIASLCKDNNWALIWATQKQIDQVRALQAEGWLAFFLCGGRGKRSFGICLDTKQLIPVVKANHKPGQRMQFIVSNWDFTGRLEDFEGFERWAKEVPNSTFFEKRKLGGINPPSF